ncbi:MAG: nucleoside phosphorylase, partial [Acetatifactor sp.]
ERKMIIDSFDSKSESKINPYLKEDASVVDACIVTFSYIIEKYVQDNYDLKQIGQSVAVTGNLPIYQFRYNGKTFAFLKTYAGAPACVATLEDTLSEIKTDKYIVFGGSGCLNKEIAHGKVMLPTEAYRDEGTSYHYAPPSDYITIKNADVVAEFMKESGIPFVKGKTWTTDSFYRETINNFEKRKADGCISVEMECSAIQAMCDFRNLNLYMFLTCGDLLDAPKHIYRNGDGQYKGTQHDVSHFEIALSLADYVTGKSV